MDLQTALFGHSPPHQLNCRVQFSPPDRTRTTGVAPCAGLGVSTPGPNASQASKREKKGKEYVPLASTSTLSKERKSNKEAPFLTGKDTNQGTDTSGWSEACSCSLDCVVR